jgi:preprotein translocase subunit SecG
MAIENIELALTIALVVDALALIALIMIQQGKGASVGAAFGSGASQTMFGSAGASGFLNTLTTWLAVGFFVITFGLAWTARERAEALGTVGIPQLDTPAVVETPDDDGFGDSPELRVDATPLSESDVPVTIDAAASEDDVPGVAPEEAP